MCGRYTIKYPSKKAFADYYGMNYDEIDFNLEDNFNIVPGSLMPVIYERDNRKVFKMRWGLIPFWAKDTSSSSGLINARSETVAEKPVFANSFTRRRCLVPSTGFYEWKKEENRKWPYFIAREDEKIFSFAGLYDVLKNEQGKEQFSYTILTKKPNELLEQIHHRMPVALNEKIQDKWLDKNSSVSELTEILNYDDPDLVFKAYPVSLKVNNPINNDPRLTERVEFEQKV